MRPQGCQDPTSDSESADPMDALVGAQQDSPSTSDEDLLQEWIRLDQVDESVTDPVVDGIATLLNVILKTGPHKEKEKAILEKYSRPKNCVDLIVPKVNEEIWKILRRFTRQRDFNLQQAQATLLKAGFAVIQIIKDNLTPDKQSVAKILMDAFRLNSIVFRNLTARRRELIAIELPARFKTLATREVDSPAYLFGTDLTSSMKEINTTNALTSKPSMPHKFHIKFYRVRESDTSCAYMLHRRKEAVTGTIFVSPWFRVVGRSGGLPNSC